MMSASITFRYAYYPDNSESLLSRAYPTGRTSSLISVRTALQKQTAADYSVHQSSPMRG